jgi:hypothetical protein
MSDANYTLTTNSGVTDEARQMVIQLSGTLSASRNVVCPTKEKLYIVKNSTSGSQSIVFKTSGGTGITVGNGLTAFLYCDGTNVVDAITTITSLNNLVIANGGNIGSVGDTDAITIASDGKTTLAEIATVSKGIAFPATQVASSNVNTLDDYEEGTWTPTLAGSTTAGTYEAANFAGFYVKIGRQVTINAIVQLASSITGGGSGDAIIGGLPFNYDASDNYGCGPVMLNNVDIGGDSVGTIAITRSSASDASTLNIAQSFDSGTTGAEVEIIGISDFRATSYVRFNWTYFAAT